MGGFLPVSLYLLDTTTISDFIKRQPQVTDNLLAINPNRIYISVISKYEIAYGLAKNPKLKTIVGNYLDELYRRTNNVDLTASIAVRGGEIANSLKEKGKPIGVPDVLIAATSLEEELIVVTSNTKHFERVEKVEFVDWRVGRTRSS